ncbi:MAG TPA: hypothetical protein VGN86_13560 [Pyrinomonadaceae bacterium]|nr:hypothetical protein [Pyrinomonadaceae bacterium]
MMSESMETPAILEVFTTIDHVTIETRALVSRLQRSLAMFEVGGARTVNVPARLGFRPITREKSMKVRINSILLILLWANIYSISSWAVMMGSLVVMLTTGAGILALRRSVV